MLTKPLKIQPKIWYIHWSEKCEYYPQKNRNCLKFLPFSHKRPDGNVFRVSARGQPLNCMGNQLKGALSAKNNRDTGCQGVEKGGGWSPGTRILVAGGWCLTSTWPGPARPGLAWRAKKKTTALWTATWEANKNNNRIIAQREIIRERGVGVFNSFTYKEPNLNLNFKSQLILFQTIYPILFLTF